MEDLEIDTPARHLIVLVHGLAGNPNELNALQTALIKQSESAAGGVYVHRAQSNNYTLHTVDGILNGGMRIADEIEAVSKKMPNISHISLIAHSVGGMFCRYAIGLLHIRNYFKSVTPLNFITISTPHLGVKRSGSSSGIWKTMFDLATRATASRTGLHLVLSDTDGNMAPLPGTRDSMSSLSLPQAHSLNSDPADPEAPPVPSSQAISDPDSMTMDELEDERPAAASMEDDNDPILSVLCRPDSVYFQGLALFKHRVAYGNVVGDAEVPFSTALVVPRNPFKTNTRWSSCSPLSDNRPHIIGIMNESERKWTIRQGQSQDDATTATATTLDQPWSQEPFKTADPATKPHLVNMLKSLSSLSWRRVAVRFTTFGGFADPVCHTHIIVARPWLNSVGQDVVDDIAENVDWSLV